MLLVVLEVEIVLFLSIAGKLWLILRDEILYAFVLWHGLLLFFETHHFLDHLEAGDFGFLCLDRIAFFINRKVWVIHAHQALPEALLNVIDVDLVSHLRTNHILHLSLREHLGCITFCGGAVGVSERIIPVIARLATALVVFGVWGRGTGIGFLLGDIYRLVFLNYPVLKFCIFHSLDVGLA